MNTVLFIQNVSVGAVSIKTAGGGDFSEYITTF